MKKQESAGSADQMPPGQDAKETAAQIRRMMFRALQKTEIIDSVFPEDDLERNTLILKGYTPGWLEGWYVKFKDQPLA